MHRPPFDTAVFGVFMFRLSLEDRKMKKLVFIEGMHCEHCSGSVKKALEQISGVKSVKVNLKKKSAVVSGEADEFEEKIRKAVSDAGFEVVSIEDKKGIF